MNDSGIDDSKRRMLERAPSHDYVTLKGLTTLTGSDTSRLDLFCMKELVDNGLDACSEVEPLLEIVYRTGEHLTLTVRDNGYGLSRSRVEKLTDFNKFYSTKYHFKIPARGALGHAFKALMGVPYALAHERNIQYLHPPIRIRTRGKEYNVSLEIDKLNGEVKRRISTGDTDVDGTEISLTLPIFMENWGWLQRYIVLLRGYALFNPEASFRLTLDHKDHEPYSIEYPSKGKRKKIFSGRQSIHWFKKTEFKQFIWAVSREEDEEAIRDFLNDFRGLSDYDRISKVIEESEIGPGIQNISKLADRDDLMEKLYVSMKKNCKKPKPDVLGAIGDKQIRNRLIQIYGGLDEFKYEKTAGIHDDESVQTPYVFEVGIGVLAKGEKKAKTEIFAGINHSPCLVGTPFDRCWLEWSQNGEEKRGYGVRGLLKHYGIGDDDPVVVVIHLISPRVEYFNYGKSELDTEPFLKPLAQTLYKACSFYHHYKRGGKRRRVGQKSMARRFLMKELLRRKGLRRGGSIPVSERTTQQGLYYKIRKMMGGKMDINRDSFTSAILGECRSMGMRREELGIFAAVRSEMYFRGQVYPVSWENIRDLAEKGSDIILIEKEGISLALAPYAEKRGVALVNSRGFIVEYAKDLMALSKRLKANLFQVTDLDDSGLLISSQVPGIPRIGIDLRTLTQLGLRYEEVAEEYKPKGHIKALSEWHRTLVEKRRIEIDSILAEVGPERLWKHFEDRMLELAPRRDLTRSIDLTVKLPLMIAEPLEAITGWLKSIGEPKRVALEDSLRTWEAGFTDIDDIEQKLQSEVTDVIEEDERTKQVSKALHDIKDNLKKYSESEIA